MRSFLVSLALLSTFGGVNSFSVVVTTPSRTPFTTNVFAFVDPAYTNNNNDETTYDSLLQQAREYAYSETTTPSEAKKYLQHILELQSDCVSGNVVGNICDNVSELVDIVAHLRQKATQKQAIMASSKEMFIVTSVVTALAVSSIITSIPSSLTNPDVVPFTIEEWGWAIRDGYLDTMIAHYIRHGGL